MTALLRQCIIGSGKFDQTPRQKNLKYYSSRHLKMRIEILTREVSWTGSEIVCQTGSYKYS